MFEFCGGHYLEFLKIRKQTTNLSYLTLTKNMVHTKGFAGVFDGYFPWGSIMALVKGAVFSLGQSSGRQFLDGRVSDGIADVLSGGIGGGIQGFVLSPFLLLKTRVMTDPALSQNKGMWNTTVASCQMGAKVIQKEGFLSLMKGSLILATKRVFDWTSRFFFVVMLENFMLARNQNAQPLSTTQKLSCGLFGGILSATLTLPLDVIVATIQQSSKAGLKTSTLSIFKEQFSTKGFRGIFLFSSRGFLARVVHVAITTMLMKNMTHYVYNFIHDS
eukprot:Sdes_comp16103_c0_seq2m5320